HVVGIGVGRLGDLVKLVVVELGVGGEAGLVLENVGHGQLGLPGLGSLQVGGAGTVGGVVVDFNGLVHKVGEVLGNGVADVKIHVNIIISTRLLIGANTGIGLNILDGVVGGVHLGVER